MTNMLLPKSLLYRRIFLAVCLLGAFLLLELRQKNTILFISQIFEPKPHIITSYRLQLAHEGKCIGSSNGSVLDVVYCDPTQKNTVHFLADGGIVLDRTGKCLVMGKYPSKLGILNLGDCSNMIRFKLVNESYLQLIDDNPESPTALCISPIKERKIPELSPKLGNIVGLTHCDEDGSSLNLIEETNFIERRKHLLLPQIEQKQRCGFSACAINKRVAPVKLISSKSVTRCSNMSECVTVVSKTARRPHLELRLAQSIRDSKGYDLPIIVYDDGVGPHSDKLTRQIDKFSNMQYIISDEEDLGIALGRTLALKLVKTKYFLLLDDDSIFNDSTNIEMMAKILDTTDASLVGGDVAENHHFGGYFQFVTGAKHHEQILNHYNGACYATNETVAGFPLCMRCDTTSNFFMAKTSDVLEVGCWSQELKVREHKDLFLRLKAAGKKVAYCPDFTIANKKEAPKISRKTGYELKRMGRSEQMETMFKNLWNLDRAFEHKLKTFFKRQNHVLEEMD